MVVGPRLEQENVEFFGTVKVRGATTLVGAQSAEGVFGALAGIQVGSVPATAGVLSAILLQGTAAAGAGIAVTAATSVTTAVTVTGAVVGDMALVAISTSGAPIAPAVVGVSAYVVSANTVNVKFVNPTAAVIATVASGATLKVTVLRFSS